MILMQAFLVGRAPHCCRGVCFLLKSFFLGKSTLGGGSLERTAGVESDARTRLKVAQVFFPLPDRGLAHLPETESP